MAQEQADEILGRIKTTKDLADMKDADYVIEAVFEKMEIKKEIFLVSSTR